MFGNGNKISETDGRGNTTHYTYDGLDRVVGKTDAEGGVSSKTYDADGRLIQTVNEEGAVTKYVFDVDSRIVEMIDALGNSSKYTYDSMDRVLTVTDARGGVTSYTYTPRGDVASVTDAEGYPVFYEYDGNHNMVKMTTVDGDTTYEYDPLDRLIATTTPDGLTERLEYDGMGRVTASIDKGGHKTQYIYDAKGNVLQTIDALGNISAFEYDLVDNLTKMTLHRVDGQDKVDEYEVTLYEYNGRRLTTKVVDAQGHITTTEYDGNGNVAKVTDADGFVTEYAYNKLDMVTHINYNGGKQVEYQYNKVGDLVRMEDWTGTNTWEVDLLDRITKATDHKGHETTYTYDSVGNQVSVGYPDGSTATKEYDLVHNLTSVTELDGRTTTYAYDGMRRVTHMSYPDGWQEDYTYDSIGQNTSILDTDPTGKDMKQQKNKFAYDACGNMTYEYMRGNGTGEATVETFYTYDALHRVIGAKENYGNHSRTYIYDSLGNLTWETNDTNETTDYKLNSLNQITEKSSDGFKSHTTYTYDKRGNLVYEEYGKNKKTARVAEYTYDETDRMVKGVNANAESSSYLFNGLGALVQQTWVIAKNGYGYHDVDAEVAAVPDARTVLSNVGLETLDPMSMLAVNNGQSHGQGNGHKNNDKPTGSDVKKTSTVVKDFVVDYTTATRDPLMEYETNGFTYRYVYGNERLSVNVTGVEQGNSKLIENGNQIRLYYHTDLRGTFDYLTSPMSQKIESWTHYNEWGEITHNAVLKCGQRELDLVKNYTGHDFDSVLSQYYAKARMYDAGDRRFTSVDPILDATEYNIKEYVKNPVQLTQYLYVRNNPLVYIDPLGKDAELVLEYGGQIYPLIASAAIMIPAGLPVYVVGLSVCVIAGAVAYYSPTQAWDDYDYEGVAQARKDGKYFDSYPGTEIPTQGWDMNPDNWLPQTDSSHNKKLAPVDKSKTTKYMDKVECEGEAGKEAEEKTPEEEVPEANTETAPTYEDAKKEGKKAPQNKTVKKDETHKSLDSKGTPNSSTDLTDENGNVIQRRYYGPDGKAEIDIDYTNHGSAGSHEVPHAHRWDWPKNGGKPFRPEIPVPWMQ